MSAPPTKTIVLRDLIPVVAERTSPAAPGFAVTTPITGMAQYTTYVLVADLLGATGGTLDIVIEQSPDGTNWYEFVHFAQLAAAGPATSVWSPKVVVNATLFLVGKNLTTTTVLAVNTQVGPPYFDAWRIRFIAGAATSAGALQSIRCLCEIGY